MLKACAKILLASVMIDLSIAILWVGLLGFIELRDTYKKAFPNGTALDRIWSKYVTKSGN